MAIHDVNMDNDRIRNIRSCLFEAIEQGQILCLFFYRKICGKVHIHVVILIELRITSMNLPVVDVKMNVQSIHLSYDVLIVFLRRWHTKGSQFGGSSLVESNFVKNWRGIQLAI